MKKFQINDRFKGYINKEDITKIGEEYLVAPSQNVLINNGEKVVARAGYSLVGAADSTTNPIETSFDWNTSTNTELPLRALNDELQVLYNGTWETVQDSYTSVDFSFTTIWDPTELIDFLVFVNGDSTLRTWSGGMTTFASATTNTITKEGSDTWAEARFLKNGTRSVIIEGTTYAYTGGESTTTLTGVTPDPTSAGHTVGATVIQAVRNSATTPASGFNNDIVSTLRNQLYVASYTRRDFYISANDDYTDYTFTSPVRAPGEGAIITLDSTPIGMAPQEDTMYIGTNDGWFTVKLTLTADLTGETVEIQRLKTTRSKSPWSRDAITAAGNYIVFVTKDKRIDFLGRVENIDTPESRPLSDPIANELLGYDYTADPHLKYHKNILYAAFPSETKVLMFDFNQRLWQAPQTFPVRRLAIISDAIHGHSSAVQETYKLFDTDTYADNENPIDARAALSYRNYGDRAWQKRHDEWYSELNIADGTSVNLTLKYDFGGYSSVIDKTIDTSESNTVFATTLDGSLGKWPLGQQPLGGITDSAADLKKVRIIHSIKEIDYYELQPVYSSNDVGQQWELLANGGNVKLSNNDNLNIKY